MGGKNPSFLSTPTFSATGYIRRTTNLEEQNELLHPNSQKHSEMPPAQNTCKNTFTISSPNTTYTDDEIHSKYVYRDANVTYTQNGMVVTPYEKLYEFKTDRNVPRLGLMMVGWGGNNGSTVTASILANKHKISWRTKEGVQYPSYFGSITQASTFKIGSFLFTRC